MPVDIVSAQPCLGCGIENINRFNPECGINGVPKCIAMNGTEEIIKNKRRFKNSMRIKEKYER